MTKDSNICFSPVFQENLNKHFPETDDEELKTYVKERICCAVNTLNPIGNTIKIEKIFLDVDCNSELISIDFDQSPPKYRIANLEVPPQIIVPFPNDSFSRKDLIKTSDNLKNHRDRNPFCHDNLCHEFGHLQDAQRSGFDYEKPNKKLLPYIDIIWNVLLESKFSKYGMALRSKDENLRYYLRKLGRQWFKPPPEDFEQIWGLENYTYKEIRKRAQEYCSSSPNTNSIRW